MVGETTRHGDVEPTRRRLLGSAAVGMSGFASGCIDLEQFGLAPRETQPGTATEGSQSGTASQHGTTSPGPASCPLFEIRVTDSASGDPVSGLELRTVSNQRYYTDDEGRILLNDPGLMGQNAFFHVDHGEYAAEADSFGYESVSLDVVDGGEATVQVTSAAATPTPST